VVNSTLDRPAHCFICYQPSHSIGKQVGFKATIVSIIKPGEALPVLLPKSRFLYDEIRALVIAWDAGFHLSRLFVNVENVTELWLHENQFGAIEALTSKDATPQPSTNVSSPVAERTPRKRSSSTVESASMVASLTNPELWDGSKQLLELARVVKAPAAGTPQQVVENNCEGQLDEMSKKDPDFWSTVRDILETRVEFRGEDSDTTATIRVADEKMCEDEDTFRAARKPLALAASLSFAEIPSDPNKPPCAHMPHVGLAFAGAGVRSIVVTLAWMAAAQEYGLMDCFSYISAVSTCTWGLANWYCAGGGSAKDVLHQVIGVLSKDLKTAPPAGGGLQEVFASLAARLKAGEPWSLTDLLAAHLSHAFGFPHLLDNDHPRLSHQRPIIIDGSQPLPIYNAMVVDPTGGTKNMELTPFEVGCSRQQMFVPTFALGRKFVNGLSCKPTLPEPPLWTLLATMGSSVAVDIAKGYLKAMLPHEQMPIRSRMERLIHATEQQRCVPVQELPNFLASMDEKRCTHGRRSSSLAAPEVESPPLRLGDPYGTDLSAVTALLRRGVNILFLIDASTNIARGEVTCPELRNAEAAAKKLGKPFPPIDYDVAATKPISVWAAPKCVTVLYMPLIAHPTANNLDPQENAVKGGYCSNLAYRIRPEQSAALISVVQAHFRDALPAMKIAFYNTMM